MGESHKSSWLCKRGIRGNLTAVLAVLAGLAILAVLAILTVLAVITASAAHYARDGTICMSNYATASSLDKAKAIIHQSSSGTERILAHVAS